MSNPLLARNMGRWAEVYFTSPPEKREEAVQQLLQELKAEESPAKPAPAPVSAKPATSEAPAAPAKTASEVPAALEVPAASPVIAETQAVPCPACFQNNLVHQRFCGLCGFPLKSESKPETITAPERAASPEPPRPIDRNDESWDWLRERNLAAFQPSESSPENNTWKYAVGIVAALVFAGLIYWFLHNSSARVSVPATTNQTSQESVPAPSTDANQSAPPAPADVVKPKKSAERQRGAQADKQSSPASEASGTGQTVDDGGRELAEGRRYLEGSGVSKNPEVASIFLWKAVAKQNDQAVLLLSDMYARGEGVAKSCDQARVLLTAAAKRGNSAASDKLESLRRTSCP